MASSDEIAARGTTASRPEGSEVAGRTIYLKNGKTEVISEALHEWVQNWIDRHSADARDAREIVDLYFSPWGAAKAVMWEDISNDAPFTADNALRLVWRALHKGEHEGGDGASTGVQR